MSHDDGRLRVLFLVNHFAPESRASANRITRFAQLLPAAGIDPLVLCLEPGCTHPNDEALLAGLPPELPVVRVPCRNPAAHLDPLLALGPGLLGRAGYVAHRVAAKATDWLSFPDGFALWSVATLPRALSLVRSFAPDVLLASVPAYSSAVLAAVVGQRSGLPFVLDYRDTWTLGQRTFARSRLRLAVHARLERWVVARGVGLLAVTDRHARVITDFLGEASRARMTVVYNAADLHLARQLECDPPPPPDGRFCVVHAGGISGQRTLEPLLRAMRQLKDRGLIGPERFVLRLFGTPARAQQRLARELRVEELVQESGPLPRTEVMRRIRGCQLTVAVQGEEFVYGLPSKVLESVALGRPVLGLSPHGSVLEETLEQLGMGRNFALDESEALAGWLARVLDGSQALPTSPRPGSLERFLPEQTVQVLATALRRAAATARAQSTGTGPAGARG